jgi:hypothetical protein
VSVQFIGLLYCQLTCLYTCYPSHLVKEETLSVATNTIAQQTENDRERTQKTTETCRSGSVQSREATKDQAVDVISSRKPKYYRQSVKQKNQRDTEGPDANHSKDKGPCVRPPPGFAQMQPIDVVSHATAKPIQPPPGFQSLTKERPAYRPDSSSKTKTYKNRRPHNGQSETHTTGKRKGPSKVTYSDSLSDL